MARNKSPSKKKRLGKKARQNRRMPVFVTARTIAKKGGKVAYNNQTRNWRTDKIGDVGE